jgi:hypothetical protein
METKFAVCHLQNIPRSHNYVNYVSIKIINTDLGKYVLLTNYFLGEENEHFCASVMVVLIYTLFYLVGSRMLYLSSYFVLIVTFLNVFVS